MNEGVIYRENNSTMNYATPVVWKDNTAIILKSMGSRACIENVIIPYLVILIMVKDYIWM